MNEMFESELKTMARRKLAIDEEMNKLKRESQDLEREVIDKIIRSGKIHLLQVRWKRVASPRYW